jgi:secondary thiamine-phosphate synthase enzyme
VYKLQVHTSGQQTLDDITQLVQQTVGQSGVEEGICHLFCPHTTAGLILNENWDPDVQHDIKLVLSDLAPQRRGFRHSEGNSPAHAMASLVGASQTAFVSHGKLVLGTWQGIFLAEFDGPRTRTVLVKVMAG